jgi:hypothetical protein
LDNFWDELFEIRRSLLPFISTLLVEFFAAGNSVCSIEISNDGRSNSLFKGVSERSLIDTFTLLHSLLNGFPPQTIDSSLQPSIELLGLKLFCTDIFVSLHQLDSNNSLFVFQPSTFFFSNVYDSEFTFDVGSKSFTAPSFCSFLLSPKTQRFYKFENITSLCIEIPSKFDEDLFTETF